MPKKIVLALGLLLFFVLSPVFSKEECPHSTPTGYVYNVLLKGQPIGRYVFSGQCSGPHTEGNCTIVGTSSVVVPIMGTHTFSLAFTAVYRAHRLVWYTYTSDHNGKVKTLWYDALADGTGVYTQEGVRVEVALPLVIIRPFFIEGYEKATLLNERGRITAANFTYGVDVQDGVEFNLVRIEAKGDGERKFMFDAATGLFLTGWYDPGLLAPKVTLMLDFPVLLNAEETLLCLR